MKTNGISYPWEITLPKRGNVFSEALKRHRQLGSAYSRGAVFQWSQPLQDLALVLAILDQQKASLVSPYQAPSLFRYSRASLQTSMILYTWYRLVVVHSTIWLQIYRPLSPQKCHSPACSAMGQPKRVLVHLVAFYRIHGRLQLLRQTKSSPRLLLVLFLIHLHQSITPRSFIPSAN